jgi:hypothetical protein
MVNAGSPFTFETEDVRIIEPPSLKRVLPNGVGEAGDADRRAVRATRPTNQSMRGPFYECPKPRVASPPSPRWFQSFRRRVRSRRMPCFLYVRGIRSSGLLALAQSQPPYLRQSDAHGQEHCSGPTQVCYLSQHFVERLVLQKG